MSEWIVGGILLIAVVALIIMSRALDREERLHKELERLRREREEK